MIVWKLCQYIVKCKIAVQDCEKVRDKWVLDLGGKCMINEIESIRYREICTTKFPSSKTEQFIYRVVNWTEILNFHHHRLIFILPLKDDTRPGVFSSQGRGSVRIKSSTLFSSSASSSSEVIGETSERRLLGGLNILWDIRRRVPGCAMVGGWKIGNATAERRSSLIDARTGMELVRSFWEGRDPPTELFAPWERNCAVGALYPKG